jgi:hypothetical protein
MKRRDVADLEYRTADLHEAVAISIFQKPIRLEQKGDRFIFIFESGKAEQIASKYWTGELAGSLRQYVDCLRSTKDWLFSKKREIENNR